MIKLQIYAEIRRVRPAGHSENGGYSMKIAFGSDPNATEFKKTLLEYVKAKGFDCTDFGSDDPIYANVAIEVAEAVAAGKFDRGILICGTGIGVSITANKQPGIRCALCGDCFSAKATREHNDANILALGARVVGPGLALLIVDTFLDTPFSNDERHIRRISLIED